MSTVLMMAGGTGGHVFPALAVADALRLAGITVEWLGTARGMEARLLADQPYRLHLLGVEGLRGRGIAAWLRAPFRLAAALTQCMGIVRRLRPRLAIGMGGFASGPGGLAARLSGVPLLVHEQNAIPGTTNRLLARLANRVLEAIPGSFPAATGAVATGNPIRADIARVRSRSIREEQPAAPTRLLVLGGSQGARWLNEQVPDALAMLGGRDIVVRHQSGPADRAATSERYARLGISAEVHDFLADIATHYTWADAAICRAGALTVSELATVGLPSLLVPFPFATDDHQRANAEWLAEAGAAEVLIQQQADTASLAQALSRLLGDSVRRHAMAQHALALGQGEATGRVAAHCLEFCHDR